MTQYIDKSALVAEIERLKSEHIKHTRNKFCAEWSCGVLDNILSFINTLEVKEADLEEEIDKFYGMYRKNGITFSIEDNQECLDWKEDCNPDFEIGFARHFFELGMRVSNKA